MDVGDVNVETGGSVLVSEKASVDEFPAKDW